MNTLIDLTGQRFGKLVVREKLPPISDGRTRWLCDCDCGNSCVVSSYALRKKHQKSCGCGRIKNIVGQRYGRLVVLKRSDQYVLISGRTRKCLWECRCDCGEIVYRLSEKLRQGKNCACKTCMGKAAASAMADGAGFVDGTQLSKIRSTKACSNNSSGVRGVFFNRRSGKWRASLKFQGQDHYLGEYVNIEDAIKARHRAEEIYFAPLLEKYELVLP